MELSNAPYESKSGLPWLIFAAKVHDFLHRKKCIYDLSWQQTIMSLTSFNITHDFLAPWGSLGTNLSSHGNLGSHFLTKNWFHQTSFNLYIRIDNFLSINNSFGFLSQSVGLSRWKSVAYNLGPQKLVLRNIHAK